MLGQNSYKALMSVVPSERLGLCDPVEVKTDPCLPTLDPKLQIILRVQVAQ